MPKYLIERDAPGIGSLSQRDIIAMSRKSNRVIAELSPDVQWNHSYVSNDKLYCEYIAKNEDVIREHAKRGKFPLTQIYPVGEVIDPTTADKNDG